MTIGPSDGDHRPPPDRPGDRAPRPNYGRRRLLALLAVLAAVALLVRGGMSLAASVTEPASAAAAAPDPLGAAGGDIYVVDHVAMADQPCHVMDHSIMGQCTDADIERLRVENAIVVNTAQMADSPCHTMEETIMGQCTEDDVNRLAGEIRTARSAATTQP